MRTVADLINDYFPADGDASVPLLSTIYILFDREMDEDLLDENIFISGPDTDQFVGVDFELLEDPDNVSQGDEFLQSPNFKGIVQTTVTFKKIDMTDASLEVTSTPYRTKMIITPNHAMSALTEYIVNIPEVTDLTGTTYEGYYTFTFTTGSGSIQALPTTKSTSVLNRLNAIDNSELSIIKTTPANHGIQVDPSTKTITLEFSAPLVSDTVTNDKIIIVAEPATEHPSAGVQYSQNELIKSLEVQDNKIIISI